MVYLVDDDPEDREFVQDALTQFSYKGPVLPLMNGKMLLDRLSVADAQTQPAVIILDLNMPLVDGFEALAEIRKEPRHSSVKIIILTASSSKADEIKCYDLGCDFFLNKPVRTDDYISLASLVNKITSKK